MRNYLFPRSLWRYLIVVPVALSLTSCFWPEETPEAAPFALPTSFSSVPLAVGTETYRVARQDVTRLFAFDGAVQAGTQQELYFATDGRVAMLHLESGDAVAPGDVIAELESEEAELDLAEARLRAQLAELRVAQVGSGLVQAQEMARLNLEIAELRLEKLRWDTSTPREDLQIAEREVEIARAELEQAELGLTGGDSNLTSVAVAEMELEVAELALTRAERAYARLYLRAPISGTVRLNQELRVGMPVQAYEGVARVVDAGSLMIESNLAAADLEPLMEGMAVEIEMTTLPGITFPGTIVTLPQPYGNGNTPFTQILPDLSAGNLSLREGAAVTVRAAVGRREGVLALPNGAIQTVAGRAYVVVRENDQLRDQQITTGLVGDTYTEIVAGLNEDMEVVGP